jgi:starch synthase
VEEPGGKALCKAALQREMGLPVRDEVPLFGVVGRLTLQKGLDVLAHALDRVLDWDLQIVLLGTGDREAEEFFRAATRVSGDRFRAHIGFNEGLAHRIEAGGDFFLMPSRFEPCGLNQMYSLRYGTLPIVRATGGLADTVEQYDERTAGGTGFRFDDLSADSLANTIGWALSTFHDRPSHIAAMRRRAMAQDFSWSRAAAAYADLYHEAYERRRGHPFPG